MTFDANTWIGHWPFRALPRRSAAQLLRQMDRHGIDKAMVASLHGLLYKDAHEANHELAAEIARHRDRLVPCAILNPTYDGWLDDLRQCREQFGMPVLRLVPDYHGYTLADPCAATMIDAAHKLKMRVALIGRVVDPRGRHRLDPGREAEKQQVLSLLGKFPGKRFLLLNFPGVMDPPEEENGVKHLYDMTRVVGANGLRLEREIKKHGAERFVFGTTMLLRYGKPACLALEKCRISTRERNAIQSGNLVKFLPEEK